MNDPYHGNRLAILTTSWPRHDDDWAGHFVREEALELRARGARVEVITPHLGVLSPFGPPGALARIQAFPPRLLWAAPWLVEARSAVRHGSFDAVIAHWAIPCGLVALSAPSSRVEIVSHGSDVRVLTQLPRAARHAIVRALTRRATTWRFVSAELREVLLASVEPSLAADIRRLSTIRAPTLRIPDVKARATMLRAELGPFHVSVGRLVPSKRVDRAISYAARQDATLVIIGDGPARPSLTRHATRLKARVRFTGELPRCEALMHIAAADALLLASRTEGCSTVAREATALGTPVLPVA